MTITSSRRAVGVAAFAAAVTLGSGLLGASPAAAQSPPDRCGSPSSGTEWIPDRGPGWDFNDACHNHDRCYEFKPYGNSAAGRLGCDRDFYEDALRSCGGGILCRDISDLYYLGVRIGGGDPFRDAEPPTGTVTVGEPETVPYNPRVTVGEPEPIPSGGGGGGGYVGGGGGFIGGGSSGGGRTGTVTVGEPEPVENDAE